MLTEMGKEGVMPTVDTFNTLMDACIRRVNPAAVPRLFKQMEQSGMRMGSGSLVRNRSCKDEQLWQLKGQVSASVQPFALPC